MPDYPDQMKGTVKQVLHQLKEAIYLVAADLSATAWITARPVPYARRRMTGARKQLAIGQQWGNPGDWAWFRFEGVLPEPATGMAGEWVLLINVGGEACVFDAAGCLAQGLTNPASGFDRALGEPGKRVVYLAPLIPAPQTGQPFTVWVQGTARDLFGKYRDDGRLRQAALAFCRDEIRKLYYDMAFLNDLMLNLNHDTARRDRLLFDLYAAANRLAVFSAAEIRTAGRILAPDLASGDPDPSDVAPFLTLSALGNSHIDLAWLWPLGDTVHKGARTFSTALTMLERYPDYIFGASQPQLYQWLKTEFPDLYAKLRPRVREGRWEPLGGMWVEADTNIPGGESLVRQILYGKRFFAAEFGWQSRHLWLPDSFGFSGALPQIARKAGLDYFCSTKLSWNIFNQYPHHTFIWQGIDGSALLAHLPPEGTYNSSAAPRAVLQTAQNFHDAGVSDRCLLLYGIGDGGGGPGEEHLEWLAREKDCHACVGGLAPVRQETALAFFERLEAGRGSYPAWAGELYLERHQGVYTTQARSKRFNRRLELTLHEVELWAALADCLTGEPYPALPVERIWQEVLLYQFHDIMAGSAICQVYRESLARYAILLEQAEQMRAWAWRAIARAVDCGGVGAPVLVFNSTSWIRREWLKIDGQWRDVTVPSLGYCVIDTARPALLPNPPGASSQELENDLLRLTFGADGALTSVYDIENRREVLDVHCAANRLAVYQDTGDAWDIPIGYADRAPQYFSLRRAEARLDGPRAELFQVYEFGHSRLEQVIRLTQGSRRIDFITLVDWRERRKMLRTSFAVQVRHPTTACEIQFGHLFRSNHRNTSWDIAKYEVPAQKWVDLSDGGYGVALLNDCKYGYKLLDNVLDLDLLRSPVYPDPSADAAMHEFTYSLYPHPGDLQSGGVPRAGYELNLPLHYIPVSGASGPLPSRFAFLETEADNIIVETVKKAEDYARAGEGLIVRLYECAGRATKTRLRFPGVTPTAVDGVDLMEEDLPRESALWNEAGELIFGPFEIHTLKLKMVRD